MGCLSLTAVTRRKDRLASMTSTTADTTDIGVNVHVGATKSATHDDNLGDGHAAGSVYKAGPAPAVCDGD